VILLAYKAHIDGKSNNGHGHAISEVSGLSSALGDRPTWGDVYTRTQLNTSGGGGIVHWANVSNKPSTFPPEYHTHSISEVIGLWAELGNFYTTTQLNTNGGGGQVHWGNITNKPDFSYNGHTHTISQITGLQGALDGKSNNGHGHGIGEISGLQGALDGKSNNVHGHSISDVSGLQGALDGKLSSENDPYGFASHWFSVSGSNVTLGIQRRNGSQAYADFNIPGANPANDYHTLTKYLGVMGVHNIELKRYINGSHYSTGSTAISEEDPKGVADAWFGRSGSTVSFTIQLRDGTTITRSFTDYDGS
jgi:hypothetical protein